MEAVEVEGESERESEAEVNMNYLKILEVFKGFYENIEVLCISV